MAGVVLKSVKKVYPGGVEAVKNIDLEIADKQFLVLVGPSGCGKSTILRMIAGLETITEGEIYIGDRVVNALPPKDRDIAMVFQNYALYPHMSVRKNLAFGLKLRKYPRDEIEQRVEEAAEILEITKLLDRKPKALSGGQRQRVAVGRSIVRKPKVFLFDEPLSNLDAKLRVQMRTEIGKLHQKLKTTMIYVTHDQTEAMTMGDCIVVLKDGVIHQIDEPVKLYLQPADKFVAGFIGSPPMNFMEGKITADRERLYFDEGSFRLAVAEGHQRALGAYLDRKVIFGVRPEDVYLRDNVGDDYPESQLDARVQLIEPMGAEIYVYFKTQNSNFIGRLHPREKIKVDQTLRLVFDMSKVHYFDGETEKTIV